MGIKEDFLNIFKAGMEKEEIVIPEQGQFAIKQNGKAYIINCKTSDEAIEKYPNETILQFNNSHWEKLWMSYKIDENGNHYNIYINP